MKLEEAKKLAIKTKIKLENYQKAKNKLQQHIQDLKEQFVNIKKKLEGSQQQPNESELLTELASLEMNMESIIKTLKTAEDTGFFKTEGKQKLAKLEEAKKQEETKTIEMITKAETQEEQEKKELARQEKIKKQEKLEEMRMMKVTKLKWKGWRMMDETKIELSKPVKAKKQEEMDFNRQESNEIEICEAESLASFGELDHKAGGGQEAKEAGHRDQEMIAKTKGINCGGINLAKIKMLTDKETESEAQHD